MVTIHGTYQSSGPFALDVWVKEVNGAPGTTVHGSYSSSQQSPASGTFGVQPAILQAYTPNSNEWDPSGKFSWHLQAGVTWLSNLVTQYDFFITIVKPDAEPYIKITNAHVVDVQGNPQNELSVEQPFFIEGTEDICITAGSTLKETFRNSPPSYTASELMSLEPDGWVNVAENPAPVPIPQDESYSQTPMFFGGGDAPPNPMADWHWDIKYEVDAPGHAPLVDTVSLEIPVKDRNSPWAAFAQDQSGAQSFVQPSHTFAVRLVGKYIFPGSSTGTLVIDIKDSSGVIPMTTRTLPNRKGKGGFSLLFNIMAPSTTGWYTITAELSVSGTAPPVYDTFDSGSQVTNDPNLLSMFCDIVAVQVNSAPTPPTQDVALGSPFNVQLQLQWHLPQGSQIFLMLYNLNGFNLGLASQLLPPLPQGGDGSQTVAIQVPAAEIPPHTGSWGLEAQALTTGTTPQLGTRIFHVNLVGAPGGGPGGGGPPGGNYDWAITGVSISPVNPSLGSNVTFTAQVGVTTSSPLPQTVAVAYSIDGVEQLKGYVTYQPGMAFLSVSSPPWTPTLGQHTVSWVVDPDMQFNDPNRANNMMKATFNVTSTPPQPPPGQTQPGGAFDFYVTAVPMEQTIDAPATYTVTVNSTSGTPQTVQLDLQGAPAGVSYYFTPPSGMPGFTSTLTVTAASTVPAGSYPLTINATAAGIARYASLVLDVTSGPDYSLAVAPDTVQASPGGTATFNVTVASNSGYGQLVNLEASDLPPNSTAKFDPSALAPNGQSTLTVQLSKDAASGYYSITVTGSGVEGKQVSATVLVQGQLANPESTEATVNYLAMGILAAIVAVVVVGVVLAVRRLRAHRAGAFCIECGTRLRPGDEYCEKCGTKQTGDAHA